MSVNTAHTPDGIGVLIYSGEHILLYVPHVDVSLEANPNPVFRDQHYKGALYLTSHRVIFVNSKKNSDLKSFSMPFVTMRNVKLEQPLFGANYMKGTTIPQANGTHTGDVVWKFEFKKGGCIDFGRALLRANDMAGRYRVPDAPPMYTPPPDTYAAAPPSYYNPGGYDGFVAPTDRFPDHPPAGTVYVSPQPPPYPGINGLTPYPTTPAAPYPAVPTPYPAAGIPPYPTGPAYSSNPPYPAPSSAGNIPSAPPAYEPPPPYEAPPLPKKGV